ncbi:serine hydrolase domain-containing protein [Actinoplanes sp. NEAU-A12]|uniref:Serine hydrolase domain-containing protein n=1 Tax=Actinoplanes sandaracinus TaxID=3045177 RepID=A0ABT6WGY0_9ACTN|nr:serine hydrolase domain-containing protein [Actinoplanes sandaracinus]MDI6098960.1 serine hydrolase domain-containing protein [Actinoplanes sandaracinus]
MTRSAITAFPKKIIANGGVRMPRLLRRAGAAALAVALLSGPATPAHAAAGPDRPELRQALQEIVDSGFVGAQVRVHDERGGWAGSAGARRLGEPARPPLNGRFRVGSSTKTFVATVALQLVAEGRLGLDEPVAAHLPGFGLDRRITLRMLLQHTSGVFAFTGDFYDGTFEPGITWSGKEWVENRFTTYQPEDLVRLSLSKPLRFAPGTDWGYSNTNYVLARLLIEKVTGHSFAVELQRRIVRPLGLRGTVAPGVSPEIPGPHAHAYYRYEEAGQPRTVDVTRQNPSWISAGGDMISTTRDLHTFISALMSGRLLPAPLLAEMRAPHPVAGYGLGLFVQDGTTDSPFPLPACGATVVTHNGGVQGYATMMYSTPDGGRTLTASLTYVDDVAMTQAGPFRQAMQTLVDEAFCD